MATIKIYIQEKSSAANDIRQAVSEIYDEADRICMDNDIAHYEIEEVDDD